MSWYFTCCCIGNDSASTSLIFPKLQTYILFFCYYCFTFEIIMYPYAHLRGTPPSTTLTQLLPNKHFLLHIISQLPFLTFSGHYNRTKGKAGRYHERALIYNLTTPVTLRHPLPPTNAHMLR